MIKSRKEERCTVCFLLLQGGTAFVGVQKFMPGLGGHDGSAGELWLIEKLGETVTSPLEGPRCDGTRNVDELLPRWREVDVEETLLTSCTVPVRKGFIIFHLGQKTQRKGANGS